MKLRDYKVRVLDGSKGTAAKVRVLVEWADDERSWTTVGISHDVIQASAHAMLDAIRLELLRAAVRDEAERASGRHAAAVASITARKRTKLTAGVFKGRLGVRTISAGSTEGGSRISTKIVIVESGPRELLETMLPFLYQTVASRSTWSRVTAERLHLSRRTRARFFRSVPIKGPDGRQRLIEEFSLAAHAAIGIVCAALPIMTKWKWMLAARVPAKLFVINENGDLFWADYSNWRIIKHFILFRAGLSGADAVGTIRRLDFPFTVMFLLAYAGVVHGRRLVATGGAGVAGYIKVPVGPSCASYR